MANNCRLEEVRHEEAEIDQQIRLLLHQREVLKVRREAILRDQDEVFQQYVTNDIREHILIITQCVGERMPRDIKAATTRIHLDLLHRRTSTRDSRYGLQRTYSQDFNI